MPLVVECPSCGKKLKVPDQLVGKQVRCADCASTFVAEGPHAGAAPPLPPVPVPARDDDEFDDDDREERTARRRRRRDYEPHRGGLILAMGIISLVVGGVGLVTGIIAWTMGAKDLKRLKAGRMDPEGQSMTQIGYILGIIGTILQILGVIGFCIYFIFIIFLIGTAATVTPRPGTPAFPPAPAPMRPAPPRPGKNLVMNVPTRLPDYFPQRLA